MNKKRMLTIFCMIYVISMGIFVKEYTNQAVSNTNLTALCLENSLPCMDIVAIEKETEQDNGTIQEEQELAQEKETEEKES